MSNFREVGIPIETQETFLSEDIAVKEEMVYLNHLIKDKKVVVGSNLYNSNDSLVKEDSVLIDSDYYELLMSGDTSTFGANKREKVFGERDVWIVVDKIRGKQAI